VCPGRSLTRHLRTNSSPDRTCPHSTALHSPNLRWPRLPCTRPMVAAVVSTVRHPPSRAMPDRPFYRTGPRSYLCPPAVNLVHIGAAILHTGKQPATNSSIFHCCAPWTGRLTGFSSLCTGQAEAPSLGESRGPVELPHPSLVRHHHDLALGELPCQSSLFSFLCSALTLRWS
jgi:hypothetical protein